MTRHATLRTQSDKLSLSITATAGTRYVNYLRKWIVPAWKLIDAAPTELSIALVNDARMAQLHKQFLNIPGPTDVLTFELDHDPAGRCTGGEVILCVDEAARRAKELDHDVADELLLYALHGVLHLSGHDDKTPAGFRKMHRREDQILLELGIGRLFDRRRRAESNRR